MCLDGPLCQNWLEQSFQFEVLCEVKDIVEGSCPVDSEEEKKGGRKAKRRKKNKTRKRNKRKRKKRRKTKR